MRYIFSSKPGARQRVVHLCGYDPRNGEPTMAPLCGLNSLRFDRSCNLPLGRPTCVRCRKLASR